MRKNDVTRMTVTEQIIAIKEDTCRYACKYVEELELLYKDPVVIKVYLQKFCKDCPMARLHFSNDNEK